MKNSSTGKSLKFGSCNCRISAELSSSVQPSSGKSAVTTADLESNDCHSSIKRAHILQITFRKAPEPRQLHLQSITDKCNSPCPPIFLTRILRNITANTIIQNQLLPIHELGSPILALQYGNFNRSNGFTIFGLRQFIHFHTCLHALKKFDLHSFHSPNGGLQIYHLYTIRPLSVLIYSSLFRAIRLNMIYISKKSATFAP